MPRQLEVCVDDAAGLAAAVAGGADRIELCSALAVGGLTPSPGLMALAAEAQVPVYAMIRPRAGDFVYSLADVSQMENDIRTVAGFGLNGIVIGASLPDGTLDASLLGHLLSIAAGLPATLHRAIDLAPDLEKAMETAIGLKFERILTSGGAVTALEGLDNIVDLHGKAQGRIGIMPGSGITAENVGALLDALPGADIHASCSSPGPLPAARVLALGFAAGPLKRTDPEKVRALKARISS